MGRHIPCMECLEIGFQTGVPRFREEGWFLVPMSSCLSLSRSVSLWAISSRRQEMKPKKPLEQDCGGLEEGLGWLGVQIQDAQRKSHDPGGLGGGGLFLFW